MSEPDPNVPEPSSRLVFAAAAAGVVLLSLLTGLIGIRWGLPSAERNALYYSTPESKAEAIRQIKGLETRDSKLENRHWTLETGVAESLREHKYLPLTPSLSLKGRGRKTSPLTRLRPGYGGQALILSPRRRERDKNTGGLAASGTQNFGIQVSSLNRNSDFGFRHSAPDSAPRSLYNPARSYHPDEYYVFKMLSGMRLPWEGPFDPEWYVIGGAYVYPLGAALKCSELLGLVTLKRDITFYIENPEEMAKLYLVGRVIDVLLAAATVLLVMLAARRLWGVASGLCAGLLLATSPLLVMHAHFMYDDVPGTFWVALAILASSAIVKKGDRAAYVLAGLAAGLAAGTKLFHGFVIFLPLAAHVFRERQVHPSPQRRNSAAESRQVGTVACSPDRLLNSGEGRGNKEQGTGAAMDGACRHRSIVTNEGGADEAKSGAGRVISMVVIALVVLLVTNPYYLVRTRDVLENFSRHVWAGASFGFYLRTWCFGLGVLPLLAAAGGLVAARVRRNRPAVVIGLWCAAYYVMLSLYAKEFARYLLPAFPAAAMMGSFLAHFASSGGQKRPAARSFATAVGLLVLLLPQFATDWDVISALGRPDSRTEAGQFILRRLPAGSTIAVTEEPWQFEMPPIDQGRFKIAVCEYDLGKLAESRPNSFIYSDLQSDPEINPHPEFASEPAFWREIDEGRRAGKWTTLYESPVYMSERKFWCALGLWRTAPEDMRYISPRVYVLAPTGSAQHPPIP